MMIVRALVVDDSGIMRKLVMRALAESRLAQFDFTEAVDGVDALAKFDPDKIDLVLVDWNMPKMSGIDFVHQVRTTCKGHVPIVMITTESTMGKVEEALSSGGVDSYICKPFTANVLKQKLAPLFEKMAAPPPKTGFFSKLAAKLG
jgi:two-component system, chemotaxis family, chemotaxis protein CheY